MALNVQKNTLGQVSYIHIINQNDQNEIILLYTFSTFRTISFCQVTLILINRNMGYVLKNWIIRILKKRYQL